MYLDGHTYSLFDPEEIHRDLRMDPVRARTVMVRSKAITESHEFCEECRAIAREQAETVTPGDHTGGYENLDAAIQAHTERGTRYMISRANLARMLGLGAGERIGRLYVDADTQILNVIIAGEHLPPVPDGYEVPASRMSRIATPQQPAGKA